MRKEYIYAIKDPRLTSQKKPDIIYIGHSSSPVEAIQRHLTRSSNPEVSAWVEDLFSDFEEGLEMYGSVIVDRYNGLHRDYPALEPGRTLLEWEILGEESPPVSKVSKDKIIFFYGSTKSRLIDEYRALGHPLLNKRVGRPPTSPPENPGWQSSINPTSLTDDDIGLNG